MRGNRSELEVQFNWIFVIIAGSIILLFFAGLVVKQKQASETRICGQVLNDLELKFFIAKEGAGTVAYTPISDLELQFSCSDYRCSEYEAAPKSSGNIVLFAPRKLFGENLLTWAKEWNVPFKVTNFLYVSTPLNRYYFIYDENSQNSFADAKKYFDAVPDNFTKEIVSLNDFRSSSRYNNDFGVTLLFFDVSTQLNIPPKHWIYDLDTQHVGALSINTGSKEILFHYISGNSLVTTPSSQKYFRDEELFGAIFSGNSENYDCNLKKAYSRLEKIALIYSTRTSYLFSEATSEICAFHYNFEIDSINALSTLASQCKDYLDSCDAAEIESDANNILATNRDLLREGCPRIY